MKSKQQKEAILAKGLKVVADLRVLQIIARLRVEPMGFNDLHREIKVPSPTTLSLKLKSMLQIGMIEKTGDDKYKLTFKGSKALPIIDEINKFMELFEKE